MIQKIEWKRVEKKNKCEQTNENINTHIIFYQIVCVYRRCVNFDQYGLLSFWSLCVHIVSPVSLNNNSATWFFSLLFNNNNLVLWLKLWCVYSTLYTEQCIRTVWEICICLQNANNKWSQCTHYFADKYTHILFVYIIANGQFYDLANIFWRAAHHVLYKFSGISSYSFATHIRS